jgi:GH15 family glucan-1,4-alpha-glucosidase
MNLTTETFKDIHSIMNEKDVALVYSGEFDQDIIKSMLKYTEGKLESSDVDSLVKRKIFNVMVEMLQNITKHQFVEDNTKIEPIFILIEKEQNYQLITGNPILNSSIENVSDRINKINQLDPIELKAFYKEARLASRISEVGGAGLGFIDMSRKTENKIEFSFNEIDSEKYKYFTLKTIINKMY